MQFKYIATNREGKKLTGLINAPEESTARTQLNTLGFSILDIKKVDGGAATDSDLDKFEFEAIDKTGKKIKGTIPAQTALLAYQRLVEEYHFDVLTFVPIKATAEESERWKGVGLQELKNQYELQLHDKKIAEGIIPLIESAEFLKKKEKLIREVDAILERIKNLLHNFENTISPDKKAAIQGYIDKLLRIKGSNNLDYIANTCKELLSKAQGEELFLENLEHHKERNALMMESQKMLLELNKAIATKKNVSLQIKSEFKTLGEKLKNTHWHFLLKPLQIIETWLQTPREMEMIKTQLEAIREQKWDALKIALKAPKETRSAAWEEFKKIRRQEKEIAEKKKNLKKLRIEKKRLIRREHNLYTLKELNAFTGWLLAFYLTYYFIGYYSETYQLGLKPLLQIPFTFKDSALFKYLLALVFLLHAGTSVKLNFFARNAAANWILGGIMVGLGMLTLFNF